MTNKNYCIFIISHKRSENIITLNTLKRLNYKGKIYIVIDDLDVEKDIYIKNYENVLVFNKLDYFKKTEKLTNKKILSVALYSRRFIEDFTKENDIKNFVVFDDDILDFKIRFKTKDKIISENINDFNTILDFYFEFLNSANIGMLGFGNETSYFGKNCFDNDLKRRIFNGFVRNRDIDFEWLGIYAEDFISCVENGKKGFICLECMYVKLEAMCKQQLKTKNQKGGMEEAYNELTDYEKSMYAVISNPSCFIVAPNRKGKLIIKCKWDNAIPKIINRRYKK